MTPSGTAGDGVCEAIGTGVLLEALSLSPWLEEGNFTVLACSVVPSFEDTASTLIELPAILILITVYILIYKIKHKNDLRM